MPKNGKKTVAPNGRRARQNGHPDGAVDLLFVVGTLVKSRKTLARNALLAATAFAVLALLLPKSYKAKAVLLPPDQQEQGILSQTLSQMPVLALPLRMNQSKSELFVEILQSRAVGEKVLRAPLQVDSVTTNLLAQWEISSVERALRRLARRTTLATTENGLIEIEVELADPRIAAQVANSYVRALDDVNQAKLISSARATREYIETQLAQTKTKLQRASDSLAWYQTRSRAVALTDQARALFEQAGELQGQIIAREVQVQLLANSMQPENPQLQRAKNELEALKTQYEHFRARPEAQEKTTGLLIPAADLPETAKRLAMLSREVKAQETVWQYLNQQYYTAKIQEARDTPTVQVLDWAAPPEAPVWPRPLLLTATGTFFIVMLHAAFLIVAASFHRQQAAEEAVAWHKLWDEVKRDTHSARSLFRRSEKKS